jgi:hypothetical protein
LVTTLGVAVLRVVPKLPNKCRIGDQIGRVTETPSLRVGEPAFDGSARPFAKRLAFAVRLAEVL